MWLSLCLVLGVSLLIATFCSQPMFKYGSLNKLLQQTFAKYIMVKKKKKLEEGNRGNNKQYKTICDIGKERIRRAGRKIKDESPITTTDLDVGYRVLKLDDSNMNEVYYSPAGYSQGFLSQLESNVKSDRTDLAENHYNAGRSLYW